MSSKKITIILASVFAVAVVAGTFIYLYLNQSQNQADESKAYNLPTAQTFRVEPFPMGESGIYSTEKEGDWDFASHKVEGWIKVRNNASVTRKIGWQIDCRPDQPGGEDCWDNKSNPKGELTVAPGEAWEVLVGRLCLPYQLDFTGPGYGRYIPPDTSLCGKTPNPTPSLTPSPTPTSTPTPSSTPTRTPTPTPSRTPSPSASPSPSVSPSSSPTSTPPIGGPSNTPSPSPSPTSSSSPTATPTSTPTNTPNPSNSSTPSPSESTVAQATTTPVPDDRTVADATSTLPEAGVSNGTLLLIIGTSSLIIAGIFTILKKKYY